MPAAPSTSPKLDLAAAYAAMGAKMAAWLVAAAVVYRHGGPAAFAALMLARATLALLNHATFGLGPALTTMVARAERATLAAEPVDEARPPGDVLDYARPPEAPPRRTALPPRDPDSPASLVRTAELTLLGLAAVAGTLLVAYAGRFEAVHVVKPGLTDYGVFVGTLGLGVLARMAGDAVGGASHALGRLAADQGLAAAADAAWAVMLLAIATADATLEEVGTTYAVSGLIGLVARRELASHLADARENRPRFNPRAARAMLWTGGLVTVAGLADFLYAPIDYVILNAMVSPLAPAVYAPAVQVDAAILILTTAIATVALPSVARLHAAGDNHGVRRAYVRGSLLAGGVALVAAVAAWAVAPAAFELWLGEPQPATVAILPLVLVHTVLGSAAGVGRATLVGVGRAGQYAVLVLVGGVVNVAVSVGFVTLGWGVAGVVAGTVVSVALRCLVATPMLVWRAAR